jgi:hypothetical protein
MRPHTWCVRWRYVWQSASGVMRRTAWTPSPRLYCSERAARMAETDMKASNENGRSYVEVEARPYINGSVI